MSDFYSNLALRNRMNNNSAGGSAGDGIVNRMETLAAQGTKLNMSYVFGSLNSTNPSVIGKREVLNRGHCEDRMACAVAMRSPEEYKYWVGEYVTLLANTGDLATIRMLCEELIEGYSGSSRGWCDCASLGIDKLTLMKDVVLVNMMKGRSASELAHEYAEILGME